MNHIFSIVLKHKKTKETKNMDIEITTSNFSNAVEDAFRAKHNYVEQKYPEYVLTSSYYHKGL